jgi:hypothetical protein
MKYRKNYIIIIIIIIIKANNNYKVNDPKSIISVRN